MRQGLLSVNATDDNNRTAIKSYCDNSNYDNNNYDNCNKYELSAMHIIVLNNKILRKMVTS